MRSRITTLSDRVIDCSKSFFNLSDMSENELNKQHINFDIFIVFLLNYFSCSVKAFDLKEVLI